MTSEWYDKAPMDPIIRDACRKYGLTQDSMWEMVNKSKDKFGNTREVRKWVITKASSEQIAAAEKISFDKPEIIQASLKEHYAVVCVTGRKIDEDGKEKVVSTFGSFEAIKRAFNGKPEFERERFPYEMAEKRAKSRVVLMMISIYGLVYGEDEIDQSDSKAAPEEKEEERVDAQYRDLILSYKDDKEALDLILKANHDIDALRNLYASIDEDLVHECIIARVQEIKNGEKVEKNEQKRENKE